MSMTIKRDTKAYNAYNLKAKLTLGQIEAVKNALAIYKERSPVAEDVYHELCNSMTGVNTTL